MTTRRKPLPSTVSITEHDSSNHHPRNLQRQPAHGQALSGLELSYTLVTEDDKHAQASYELSHFHETDHDRAEVATRYLEPDDNPCRDSFLGDSSEAISSNNHVPYTESSSLAPATEDASAQHTAAAGSKARLKLVTALEDTSLFLGGLIRHPIETNRHFTILRHSHGLVYYKGPQTSLALSIFSDSPLPAGRRLWLQLKGWTGGSGMRVKALFRANESWCNVTPDRQIEATELPTLDERAWQRDIKKFLSKADKIQRAHRLRETVIVRIPYEANDGYFRIVLTAADSRRVLCPSPVFRVASTSISASSLKGASLKTLPAELGVKVVQIAATTIATNAVAPFAMTVKNQGSSAVPLNQYASHVQTAWNVSGAQDQLDKVNDAYAQREADMTGPEYHQFEIVNGRALLFGADEGPEPPFPFRLKGTIVKGTGENGKALGIPTANLDNLPADQLAPLALGVYFGWAFVVASEKAQQLLHEDWRRTIITITHTSSKSQVAHRKVARAYLVHDFPTSTSFIGSKLKLVVMGYLRPLNLATSTETALFEATNDLYVADASLSRPAWHHEEVFQRIRTNESARSMTDRMVDLRISGQRRADTIPFHKLGYRSDSFGLHDRGVYGNGGLFVKRDID